jgi:ribosomal protein S18 acetylase RimI-like enzyme
MEEVRIEREEERLTLTAGAARVLVHVFPDGVRYAFRRDPGPDGDGLAAIARALAGEVGQGGGRVLSWEREQDEAWNGHLRSAGFAAHRRKVFVERDLSEPPEEDPPFDHQTLAELGDREFLRWLDRASEGDPFEDEEDRDPEREYRELIDLAGDALDRALWRVALLEGEPVGIVLPQPYAHDRKEGTLFYVGVLPEHRGRGIGRRLHRAGLALLAAAGVVKYLGSSDVRNAPMLRIFTRNGCRTTGTQVYFRLP